MLQPDNQPPRPLVFSPPPEREFLWLQQMNISDVIDVGAHRGGFVRRIRPVLPNARIHCIEPLPQEFQSLKSEFSGDPNIVFHNTALSSSAGSHVIYRCEYSESSSLLPMADLHKQAFPFTEHSSPVTIQMARMDDVIDRDSLGDHVMLKIDAQGYEMEVLRGAENTLPHIELIVVEITFRTLYEGQPLFDDVYQYLRERGWRFNGFFELGEPAQLRSPIDGRPLQADAIFMRS